MIRITHTHRNGTKRVIYEGPYVPPNLPDLKKYIEEKGRACWTELHQSALDGTLDEGFFKKWMQTIPAFGCSCRKDFAILLEENPFEPSFAWTVKIHNRVNQKLKKPEISLEEALQLWR